MALQGSFLSDQQFQCPICLDVFWNPSSTPCGHSFCMSCISRYWDGLKVCHCPLCKRTFQKRPDLQINRTLREITEQFRSMKKGRGLGKKTGGRGDGDIRDFFLDAFRKKRPHAPKVPLMATDDFEATALLGTSAPSQSTLAAMSHSFRPPPPSSPTRLRSSSRRRFTVTGAASSDSLPICHKHRRGILMYCRTDRECICPECAAEDHSEHDTVTIEDEWMETKAQLETSEQEITEMIKLRIKKMEEIRMSVNELEMAVSREVSGSLGLFSSQMSAIERAQAELLEVVEMSRRAAEHQADALSRQLELEVKELRRRESALDELAQSEDPAHCLLMFPVLSSAPSAKDWSAVSLKAELGTGPIYRELAAQLETFQDQLATVAEAGFPALVPKPSPVRFQPKMKRVQEYSVEVTLDFETAHPKLIVSDDMKSVSCGDHTQMLPDNRERFDRVLCVLGRERITSGRHYWEVEVGDKTDWDLGVAKQSVCRKGKIEVTPSNGFWFLSLREKNKFAWNHADNFSPNKIGIFVDFENGQVSFYNVEAKLHVYTFNDIFGEGLYPFFSPCANKCGKNEAALTITPVEPTE